MYLEFLGGRCRPNTVLAPSLPAAAYDLKVFFTVVGKPPEEVRPADVLAFITAQRTGRTEGQVVLQPVDPGGEPAGVSAATVRRRLSIVSGFFAFLQARWDAPPWFTSEGTWLNPALAKPKAASMTTADPAE